MRLTNLPARVTKEVSATHSGEGKIAEIVKNEEKANTYSKTLKVFVRKLIFKNFLIVRIRIISMLLWLMLLLLT